MISFLKGSLRKLPLGNSKLEILVNGIGYEVLLPVFVFESLHLKQLEINDEIELEIYYHATERSPKPILVGFNSIQEKNFFEQMIQVEGVGPQKAVTALIFPIHVIARAIETEDVHTLTQMPGIGSRAAQKIVATLKGKVGDSTSALIEHKVEQSDDADIDRKLNLMKESSTILVNLGYKEQEAIRSINEATENNSDLENDLEALIREIFKKKQDISNS